MFTSTLCPLRSVAGPTSAPLSAFSVTAMCCVNFNSVVASNLKKNASCKSTTMAVRILTNSFPYMLVYIRELQAELGAY